MHTKLQRVFTFSYSSQTTVEKSVTPTTPTSTGSSTTTQSTQSTSSVTDNASSYVPEVVTLQEFINCSSPVNVCTQCCYSVCVFERMCVYVCVSLCVRCVCVRACMLNCSEFVNNKMEYLILAVWSYQIVHHNLVLVL